jgi:hypothetical protein
MERSILEKYIDRDILNFIESCITGFNELEVIKYFGINPKAKINFKILAGVIDGAGSVKKEEICRSVKHLIDLKVLKETVENNEKYYELSNHKNNIENIKRFKSYYDKTFIRLLIIGHLLDGSLKKKK